MKSILIAALTFAAQTTFASGLSDHLMRQIHRGNATPKHHKIDAAACTNFTGNWVGTCVDSEGETSHETMTIVQKDCYSYEVDSLTIPFGGSVLFQANPPSNQGNSIAYTISRSAEWNDAQTRVAFMDVMAIGGFAVGSVSTSTMYLDNDTLKVEAGPASQVYQPGRVSDWQESSESCTYTKAN